MCDELSVVVRVDVPERDSSTVSGRIESRYGSHPFFGWLDLFGGLEEVVDRARRESTRAT